MKSFKLIFIISLSLTFRLQSNAGTIEENFASLNRCDNLYCPSNTQMPLAPLVRANLALRVDGVTNTLPSILPLPQIRVPAPQQPTNPRTQPQGVGNGTGAGSSEVNDPNSEVNKSNIPTEQEPQPSSGQSGGSVSQFNSPNGANNNSQLKAGLLYSNDDEEANSNKPDLSNKSGSALANLAPKMDPVKQNLNNSSMSDDSGSPYKPNSGTSASDFGRYQSGTPAPAKGIVGQIKDELAGIADSLGEKFFGDLGGKGSRGKSGSSNSKNSLAKNAKLNMDKASDINARDLLKRGLAQFGGRGLANHLEFGASNTSLFGNMCQHYVNYALRHHIPNDRSPCPLK